MSAGFVDRAPDALRRCGHVDLADAKFRQRVDEGVHHRRQRASGARLAAALRTQDVGLGRHRMEFMPE